MCTCLAVKTTKALHLTDGQHVLIKWLHITFSLTVHLSALAQQTSEIPHLSLDVTVPSTNLGSSLHLETSMMPASTLGQIPLPNVTITTPSLITSTGGSIEVTDSVAFSASRATPTVSIYMSSTVSSSGSSTRTAISATAVTKSMSGRVPVAQETLQYLTARTIGISGEPYTGSAHPTYSGIAITSQQQGPLYSNFSTAVSSSVNSMSDYQAPDGTDDEDIVFIASVAGGCTLLMCITVCCCLVGILLTRRIYKRKHSYAEQPWELST